MFLSEPNDKDSGLKALVDTEYNEQEISALSGAKDAQ